MGGLTEGNQGNKVVVCELKLLEASSDIRMTEGGFFQLSAIWGSICGFFSKWETY